MQDLPAGTLTLLFTDIEGSTKLLHTFGERYPEVLQRHRDLLRGAFTRYGGVEVDTQGDAFFVVFAQATKAIEAAVAAQHSLAAHEWPIGVPVRVRMGLHTGEPQKTPDGYVGLDLHRAARISNAAHGGQVLLSITTTEQVRHSLPDGVGLRNLGAHRLKDLVHPERLYQLELEGLQSDFPPVRSLDARMNNLPISSTPLIGREREIEELVNLLRRDDVRFATLTGTGGAGKTRLGLQVAAQLLGEFEHGVFFVPLASISDPALVLQTIAQAFDVREAAGRQLIDQVKDYLREKQMLLVVDNFEQVIDAASVLTDLLAAAPRLKILTTSREVLRVYGERAYAVPPLALPDLKRLPPLERLTQYASVELFIARACAVKRDFVVDNDNAPAVAEICYRVDGLPLAIELAAARVRLLPPRKMLAQLGDRLRFLTSGARDLPARQQTLRGAIDWSHELLDESDKLLFRRLGVFVGGGTLKAVESVCNADGKLDVLNGLQSLMDKSLLMETAADDEPRFSALETVREYAQERLLASGEDARVRGCHLDCFLKFAEDMVSKSAGPEEGQSLNRLEKDYDNLRTALAWALERHEIEPALRLSVALGGFWDARGYFSEGRQWLKQVLEAGYAPLSQSASVEYRKYYGRALNRASQLASRQADYSSSHAFADQSLTLCREVGDKRGIALSLGRLGAAAGNQGDHATARVLLEQSLELWREVGDKRGIAGTLGRLADVAAGQGDYATERALLEDSLKLSRESGDKRGIAEALRHLGIAAVNQGDYAAARVLHEESLTLSREVGDKRGIARSLDILGFVAGDQGDFATARALSEQGLALCRELGDRWGSAQALANLGDVALHQGDYATARVLYEQSLSLRREYGDKMKIGESLLAFARLVLALHRPLRAIKLSGAVEALYKAMDIHLDRREATMHTGTIAAAHAEVDEATFNAEWAQGHSMTLEQAVEYALKEEKVG